MPKIRINEIDNTGVVSGSSISNIVYVPGPSTTLLDPILCRSIKELNATSIDIKSLSYRLMSHLINLGFEILVEGIGNAETVPSTSWERLKDKTLYDVRFITNGQYKGFSSEMIACAEARQDCIALINVDEEAEGFSYTPTAVRGAFQTASGKLYTAAFTPSFKTKASDLLGEHLDVDGVTYVKDTETLIPAAFGYLFAYANSVKNNPEWFAVAGFERGVIPELTSLLHNYSGSDIEILQGRSSTTAVNLDDSSDNVGFAINPIAYIRPAGNIIYGNRTMKVNAGDLTAQSFLNIRNMTNAIKKAMFDTSRKLGFEQNTEILWANFQSCINPLLDKMQSGDGIYGYRFIKQSTSKKVRLKARLKIVPVEAVEDFDLEVMLTDSLEVVE